MDLVRCKNMDCHFCGEKLIEGYLNCPGCRHLAFDIDYLENMDKMEKKYSKTGLLELSEENLTIEEIVTIYTFIERADHYGGEGLLFDEYSQNGTFSNLRKRLDEMRGGN